MQHKQEFPVVPPPAMSLLWLWIPLLLAACALIAAMTMAPAPVPPAGWLGLPLVLLVGAALGLALRRRRILLDNRRLQVQAAFYTRTLDLEALDLDKARVLSLEEHTDLAPAFKTNGFGLPGFRAGHYRLRNLNKAFCLLTDRTRVLVLPQRDGGLILVSPQRPTELLAHLRELAAPMPHR